jgi:hypothetical protein
MLVLQRYARLDAEVHKLRNSVRTTSEPSLMVEIATLKAKNEELIDRLHRCGLKLLVYEALSYKCMRPQATSVCGLKLLMRS